MANYENGLTKKPLFLQKKFIVLAIIILVLLVVRLILPSFILKNTNKFLAEVSPAYSLHIDRLGIHIIRGAYSFHGLTAELKEDHKKFLDIEDIDVSIAWRELFKGRIVTDIETNRPKFLLIKDIKKLSKPKKEEATDVKDKLFPVSVTRVDLKDASITFEGYESLNEKDYLTITNINGRITNLKPTEKNPLSYFNLKANMLDPEATLKIAGELNMIRKPLVWDVDAEVRNFHMNLMNPYFKKHMPLSFTKGTLDLYSEAQSTEGKVKGYLKPFLRELDVVANKEHFKNAKHFGFEMISALGNLILRESKTKSVATRIDFTYDKKLNFNVGKSVSKAIEHGFEQQLSPGIEDQYKLQ